MGSNHGYMGRSRGGLTTKIHVVVSPRESRCRISDERATATHIGGTHKTRALIRGFLTNLLNPKPLLFCSVLLPQFVHPGAGPILEQFAVLGALLIFVGLLFDSTFALWGAVLGSWLARRPAVQTGQRYGFATVLIGFGAELMMMRAPL